MTKELFEKLIPYEDKLHTAYYCDFVRIPDIRTKEELAKLYAEEFGDGGKILTGCNRCVINALKNLGKAYFDFKKKIDAEKEVAKEPEPNTQVVENKEVTKPKTKRATNKTKKVSE